MSKKESSGLIFLSSTVAISDPQILATSFSASDRSKCRPSYCSKLCCIWERKRRLILHSIGIQWEFVEWDNNFGYGIRRKLCLQVLLDVVTRMPKSPWSPLKAFSRSIIVYALQLQPLVPFLYIRHNVADQRLLLILIFPSVTLSQTIP
jgi:hypothetical protein